MHLQRLDGGRQRARVLVQPEVHGFQFLNAFFKVFHIERGGHPTAQAGHLRHRLLHALRQPPGGLAGQVLHEFEARYKLAKTAGV